MGEAGPLPVSIGTVGVAVVLAAVFSRSPRGYQCGAYTKCGGWNHAFARGSFLRVGESPKFRSLRWLALNRALQVRSESGGGMPAVVTIGASDLSMDFMEYRELIQEPHRWRMVFVEPIPWLLPALEERIKYWGTRQEQVHVVNAAICNSSTSSLNLHMIPLKAIEELNLTVIKRELSHLSSLDRRIVKKGIRESAILPEELKSILEKRVRAVPVPCVTPADMLREAKVAPEDVEALFVDAEGRDAEILRSLLALEGLAPTTVKLEWINAEHAWKSFMDLVQEMASKGCLRWKSFMDLVQEMASKGYAIRQEYFDLLAVSTRLL